jgi:hypothetical protein
MADERRIDPRAAQDARTAPAPPGSRADGPTPSAQTPRSEEAEPTNITIPGGKYGVPGDPGKFTNAQGEPIDESGKKIRPEDQG